MSPSLDYSLFRNKHFLRITVSLSQTVYGVVGVYCVFFIKYGQLCCNTTVGFWRDFVFRISRSNNDDNIIITITFGEISSNYSLNSVTGNKRMWTFALYNQLSPIGRSHCSQLPFTKQIFTQIYGPAKRFCVLKQAVSRANIGDPCSIYWWLQLIMVIITQNPL
jgi:hypothetical protein